MTSATDNELMASAVDDPAAFAAVYDRHGADMFRYLARRVGPTDAELLLSELFVVAFEKRQRFDPAKGELRGWLYGIGSNLLANYRRAQARRLDATARLWTTAAPPSDEVIDAVVAQALMPAVAAAIADLPEGERTALLLFAWEHLSYEQIAATLDVPIGTVRSRINRARKRLRDACPELGEGEWP